MMKFVDWLNSKTGALTRDGFNFECTYFWTTILAHLVMLALVSVVLYFILIVLGIVVAINLEHINVEWAQSWLNFMGFKYGPTDDLVYFVDLVILLCVAALFSTRIEAFVERCLNRYCKRIPKKDKAVETLKAE